MPGLLTGSVNYGLLGACCHLTSFPGCQLDGDWFIPGPPKTPFSGTSPGPSALGEWGCAVNGWAGTRKEVRPDWAPGQRGLRCCQGLYRSRGTCGGRHGEGGLEAAGAGCRRPAGPPWGLALNRFSCNRVLPSLARSPASHTVPPPTHFPGSGSAWANSPLSLCFAAFILPSLFATQARGIITIL